MKNIFFCTRRIILSLAIMLFAVSVSGQALRTGYFSKGNLFRYRINPAYMSESGFVSVPLLGGVQATTMGNISFDDLFYENPNFSDEYVTFMDESVDEAEFLSGLESDNMVRANVDIMLMSAGFKAFGGFNTIDLSLRSNVAVNLPYGMLHFMKVANPLLEGLQNGNLTSSDIPDFSFGDIMMHTRNFIDLSLGHSRKIGKNLTVGARAKFLFGVGYANVEIDQMNVQYDNIESWTIDMHGVANMAFGGEFKYSKDRKINNQYAVVGYDHFDPGLQGFGLGLDFGATYDLSDVLLKGLTVSASVNDLGFIRWNKSKLAELAGEEYTFDGFDRMGMITGENSFSDQLSDLGEDMEDFFALEDKGDNSVTSGIGAKVNLGAEYVMPFYKNLTAGILYTHCFDDIYSYDQTSIVVSVSPVKVLDLAVSSTFSTFGTGFGAVANLRCPGFNFFVGTDCFFGTQKDYFVPEKDMNGSVSFGVNIPLGKIAKKTSDKK